MRLQETILLVLFPNSEDLLYYHGIVKLIPSRFSSYKNLFDSEFIWLLTS